MSGESSNSINLKKEEKKENKNKEEQSLEVKFKGIEINLPPFIMGFMDDHPYLVVGAGTGTLVTLGALKHVGSPMTWGKQVVKGLVNFPWKLTLDINLKNPIKIQHDLHHYHHYRYRGRNLVAKRGNGDADKKKQEALIEKFIEAQFGKKTQ